MKCIFFCPVSRATSALPAMRSSAPLRMSELPSVRAERP